MIYIIFINYNLYEAEEPIQFAKVWLGKESFVPLVLNEDLSVTIKKKNIDKFKIIFDAEAYIRPKNKTQENNTYQS